MANVPSTANNTKDESFVMIQCDYKNVIDNKGAIPDTNAANPSRAPREYKEVNSKLLKNMEIDRLSEKGKAVISSLEESGKKIIFANESCSYGDCDEEGPTEIFHTLFLIVEDDDTPFTCLKFYREVYYKHGDSNSSVDYYSEEPYDEDKHMFDVILQDMHSNDYTAEEIEWESKDHVYNTKPSDLSKPGKAMFDEMQEGLAETDEVFFVGEYEDYGETDRDGPVEYFFTLYIFFKKADGTIVHRKFFREFNWRHDKEMDAVPYYDDVMSDKDFQRKQFHL
jgi:hypothetical protein